MTMKKLFLKKRQGFILALTAILTMPLLLLVGFMVDLGHAWRAQIGLQAAAQSGALAGIRRVDTNPLAAVQEMIGLELSTGGRPLTVTNISVTPNASLGVVSVIVSATSPSLVMRIVGIQNYPIQVSSTAIREATTMAGPPWRYKLTP